MWDETRLILAATAAISLIVRVKWLPIMNMIAASHRHVHLDHGNLGINQGFHGNELISAPRNFTMAICTFLVSCPCP